MNNINIKVHHKEKSKKRKDIFNLIKIANTITGIIIIIVWLCGSLITIGSNEELGIKIINISAYLIASYFLITLLTFIIWIIYIHLKSNKLFDKICSILYSICTITFIAGLIILFLGRPFDDIYMVEEVKVLDVRENKILIDDSINNHGDNKIIEINKPFYASIKEGDTINVRYKINKREKMHYVIDYEVGELLIIISAIISAIITPIHVLLTIIFYSHKKTNNP